MQKEASCRFSQKKYKYLGPWNFFKMKILKIWIRTSKIMPDLWLGAVFCQTKKKSLHPMCYESRGLTKKGFYSFNQALDDTLLIVK